MGHFGVNMRGNQLKQMAQEIFGVGKAYDSLSELKMLHFRSFTTREFTHTLSGCKLINFRECSPFQALGVRTWICLVGDFLRIVPW